MYINTVVVRLSLFVYRLSKTVVKVVEEQPLTDNLRKVEGRRQKVKCETGIGGRTLGVVDVLRRTAAFKEPSPTLPSQL